MTFIVPNKNEVDADGTDEGKQQTSRGQGRQSGPGETGRMADKEWTGWSVVEGEVHTTTGRQNPEGQRQKSWSRTEGRWVYREADNAGRSEAGRVGNQESERSGVRASLPWMLRNDLAVSEGAGEAYKQGWLGCVAGVWAGEQSWADEVGVADR